jgi:protein N-terminal amidase
MLVLPEMALTGYIFKDNAAVQHLLEDPYSKEEKASPSLQLAKQLAIRLQCYVVIGCPVKLSSAHEEVLKDVLHHDARPADLVNGPTEVPAKDSDGCFNAALLVDAQGQLVHVFRKHFSYKDDKTWACEGPGFQCVTLPRFGKVCIAICMDLNREYLQT